MKLILLGGPVCLAELPFVLPKKGGVDIVHHWLYTADIDRMPDGDCSTDDLDDVYEAGVDGRFSKLIGTNARGRISTRRSTAGSFQAPAISCGSSCSSLTKPTPRGSTGT